RVDRDEMVGGGAVHVVRRHEPDLLLLHFLCVDSLQHLHGPRSPEAYWALEYVDGLIGRLLGALPAGALDHTTVFVLSDHGFLPSTREIRPNVRLRRLGALRVEAGKITGEARFVMNHGAGALYRLDGDVGAVTRLARDIKAGIRLPTSRRLDVAPTIAASLGLDLGPIEGVTLQQVLD